MSDINSGVYYNDKDYIPPSPPLFPIKVHAALSPPPLSPASITINYKPRYGDGQLLRSMIPDMPDVAHKASEQSFISEPDYELGSEDEMPDDGFSDGKTALLISRINSNSRTHRVEGFDKEAFNAEALNAESSEDITQHSMDLVRTVSGDQISENLGPGTQRTIGKYKRNHPGCNAPPFEAEYHLKQVLSCHERSIPDMHAKKYRSHKTVHSQERQFRCEVGDCGKTFKRKHEMKRHKAVHEKPAYVCSICSYKTPRKDTLQRHIKTHQTAHR